MPELDGNGRLLAVLDERTEAIVKQLDEMKELLSSQYVTKEELKPIRVVFYGVLGLMLTSIMAAIMKLVLVG